ncbi:uncharacterized protein PHACADRAFT_181012 [Phanerochaete carnosa HHB-10118-sp]|uniref:DUF6534 domain-containing protein n=1 Tax=Phanerochaete carnosa (strain HHB-10118-sp) TaxID=650164 RepID=K5WHZ7_PHACS|nr:uncharacterized protein PHACADRAFT_181012 [Phanerochaete carnosa HHB-10118-sp]EKM58980.1 hypothetical protein PHACADRAFT_181012 [Phanerochaete carnosa HHB-10118-sp]
MPQTHSFVGMLLVYTVSTGMLTSVVAVGVFFGPEHTFGGRVSGDSWYVASTADLAEHLSVYFVLGEVYASSFMAWLNAREHFRRTLEHRSYSPAIHVTSVRFAETMLFMDHGLDSDSQATCEDSTCDQDTLAWSDKTETQYGGFFASSQTFHSRRTRRRRSL